MQVPTLEVALFVIFDEQELVEPAWLLTGWATTQGHDSADLEPPPQPRTALLQADGSEPDVCYGCTRCQSLLSLKVLVALANPATIRAAWFWFWFCHHYRDDVGDCADNRVLIPWVTTSGVQLL